ncbi:serine hydrolase domain-containing protein [Legionella waltersii]|uniref:D-alanyl-D-alanine carboxypeptidase n=1 Tax=Legionella waltersii TaxID=66969 RepID=A0A0W1AME3_9GAMM|nr:serine hydrolase domain-containing protein [Legionella waltersii]KTD82503.1 D-alanyl-D-alanine carboxypeptidase [Legionella waltersii]SNV02935.1 D-alanyl-D-alanine carboxypeptidase [Legionella waltersii]
MFVCSRLLTFISILFLSALISATHASSTKNELALKIQKEMKRYFKEYQDEEKFTALAVSIRVPHSENNDSEEVLNFVKGTMGQPPLDQKITTNNLFDIGSITKSFTALILLQLQSEGVLSLDDPLGKWLPHYENWSKVTIRHLLNMTSGIPNYSDNSEFWMQMEHNLGKVWTDEELLTYAHPEKAIETDRPSLYEYSNSNYILAALVIEKATQDTFENQLKKRIFDKTNFLQNTYYPAGPNGVNVGHAIKDRKAHGYYYDEGAKNVVDIIDSDLSWAAGAGAIVANTEDVARWVQLLYHGLLIQPEYREQALSEMKSVVSMNTGLPISNVTENDPGGFGLGVGYAFDKKSNNRFWVYQGSTLGYRVMYIWSACNDVSVVAALNSKGGDGKPGSKMGNHIFDLDLTLYKKIMKVYPELRCVNH